MVYVFLADGFEEVEALTPIDVLRRASVDVRTVGVTGKTVTGSHGVPMIADLLPEETDLASADLIFLPGGMPGTKNLYASDFVRNAVEKVLADGHYVSAICAAPSIVLGGMGLLKGKRATCYPGMEDGMIGAIAQDVPCVWDGKIITGRGAGAAFDFALILCEALCGRETADKIAASVCYAR